MGEGVSQAKNQDIDVHLVLTVYDSKDWIGDFLEPAVKIEKSGKPGIFYTDPEKAGKYSVLRINKETILSGFTGHTIHDIGINVKSQNETLQFKSWFGDSKVVDENGKPLEVYHGTNWDGWEFDTENGAFFSEKEDYAEEMAAQRGGSRTVKAYLSIKNPLEVKVPGNKMADPAFEARIIAEAKSKGHDGVKLETDTNNEIEKDVFWVAFEPNQIKSATDNVGTFDPGNPDVRFSVAPDEELELDRVNQAFNSELQKQINGELPKGYLYQLGRPGSILRSTGIPDLPIEMSATRLAEKAETAHHPFNIEDMKDLPFYLNKPIGVFEYGNKDKAQNIVVEIQKEDKHFIVGLSLNFKHDGLVVNSIRGLYPKDTHEWLTWIQKNKALYLNKEKVQAQIDQQRRNPADVNYLDLDLISKIVRDFQNANGEFENSSRNSVSPEADAELELVRGISNSESGMRDAKLEQTGEAIRFIYEGDRAIPIAEGFQFDKTRDMQESMKEYILALRDSGKHFVIREDQVDVRFNHDSGDEFFNSTYTQKLRNYKSKLFKAKAKCVAAIGSIIENARNGRKENATEGHSKAVKNKKFGRYDIEFALPSGEKDAKVYTGELVVLLGNEEKSGIFYDITNIKYDRKAGIPLIRESPTGALPEEEGQLRTHLPVGSNLPSSAENASEGTGKTSEKINGGTDEYGDGVRSSLINLDLTEDERALVNIMKVLVSGQFDPDFDYAQRVKDVYGRYELQAEDGAMRKVIVDFNRKKDKNRSVMNFYSDRESDPRGQASSGGITDLSNNLSLTAENASGGTGKTSEKINGGTDEYGDDNSRLSVAPDDAFVQAWAKVLLPVVSTQYINVDGATA